MSLAPLLLGVFKAVERLSQVLSGGSFEEWGDSGVGRSRARWVCSARAGTGRSGSGCWGHQATAPLRPGPDPENWRGCRPGKLFPQS